MTDQDEQPEKALRFPYTDRIADRWQATADVGTIGGRKIFHTIQLEQIGVGDDAVAAEAGHERAE